MLGVGKVGQSPHKETLVDRSSGFRRKWSSC